MTDEQYAELRRYVRNNPAATPAGDFGGIPIKVDADCGDSLRMLYGPPRVEMSPANYADLRRRLAAELDDSL